MSYLETAAQFYGEVAETPQIGLCWGVSRGWGSIIVWGTVDLEQSEQRKKDRR